MMMVMTSMPMTASMIMGAYVIIVVCMIMPASMIMVAHHIFIMSANLVLRLPNLIG